MSTKLKCLLLDDELPGLTYLRMLCEQINDVEVVKAFNDPQKFLEAIPQLQFDLCILDIEMPGLNGMQVAELIKDKLIIFTTAYKEYAAEAFDLNAVDYIRKPFQKERLEKAIDKAKKMLTDKSLAKQSVQFNTDKGKAILLFDEMLYITTSDTDKRDKIVFLEGETRITLKNISFKELLALLPKEKFCRVNKKDVIALKAVQFYTHEEIRTKVKGKNKEAICLPLNESYREEFKEKLG
ncbi:MAG: response regulator transcription factor [Bacteroidia bacterium]|nr:response regulator transcription factor [Bacteroidia bacterium]